MDDGGDALVICRVAMAVIAAPHPPGKSMQSLRSRDFRSGLRFRLRFGLGLKSESPAGGRALLVCLYFNRRVKAGLGGIHPTLRDEAAKDGAPGVCAQDAKAGSAAKRWSTSHSAQSTR